LIYHTIDSTAGGPGGGINQAGDMAGVLPVPYLYTVDGTLTKMPLPSGATGAASSVTSDRWLGGDYLKQGVDYPAVWKVQQDDVGQNRPPLRCRVVSAIGRRSPPI
jgi:hypothetical protein